MSYLSDFKEFDGGYVTFGGRAKGVKITGKETLKTDGLVFDSSSKNASNDESQPYSDDGKKDDEGVSKASGIDDQEKAKTDREKKYRGATTTITCLEVVQGSGNIDKTLTMHHDSPLLTVNTLGSDEGSMTQQELMVFWITLSKKVESLEIDLKQTKQIYGVSYTKLIKKVKKLEKTAKSNQARRRARIIVSDDENDLEDSTKHRRKITKINQDPSISLVQHDVEIQGRYGHDLKFEYDFDTTEKDVSTAEPVSTSGAAVTTDSVGVSTPSATRNTKVSTTDDITIAETRVYIRKSATKDKGNGKMNESETLQTKIKLQQEQERLVFEAAVRLQAELNKEESQRIARVHESASSFNVEEWEDIQARVEADEELVQRLQAEEREKYTKAEQARMLAELINQRKRRFTLKALGSTKRSSELEIILREGNRHLHAGREGASVIKGNSYIDAGRKALGGSR
nr:hypothetical protein [Tanacetum cinerariifolium]